VCAVLDSKDYFEVRWASVHALREFAVLYKDVCGKRGITHVKDTVVALNRRSAVLGSGEVYGIGQGRRVGGGWWDSGM